MIVVVRVKFALEKGKRYKHKTMHEALKHLRAFEIETTSKEQGELYAQELVSALERESDR